jgi:ribosome-associated heat shock protein Hsp15
MSGGAQPDAGGCEVQRLDKWLWFVRLVKSRTSAAALVADGKVRVNRERASKPSQTLRVGDVVTVAVHARVRVLRVLATGARRGPPAEARRLYEDLAPEPTRQARREPGI